MTSTPGGDARPNQFASDQIAARRKRLLACLAALRAQQAASIAAEQHLHDLQQFHAGMEAFLSDMEQLCFSDAPSHAHVDQRSRHHAADLILAARDRIADDHAAAAERCWEIG